MDKFKAGDKVIRTGRSIDDFMMYGNTYIVEEADDRGYISVEGSGMMFDETNFVLEPKQEKLKKLKFRVESPEHFYHIQKHLVNLGYKWGERADIQQLSDYKFLLANSEGYITVTTETLFKKTDHIECELKILTTYYHEEIKPELVEYNGAKYEKSAFEKAISGLKAY